MPKGYPKNGINNGWFKKGQKFGKRNHVKKGHPTYSDKEKNRKIGEAHREERAWNWKGDKVGIGALHRFIERRLVKPKVCQNCKRVPPFDLANISQNYKRDLNDWEWLCRKCHMIKDGRIKNKKHGKRSNN